MGVAGLPVSIRDLTATQGRAGSYCWCLLLSPSYGRNEGLNISAGQDKRDTPERATLDTPLAAQGGAAGEVRREPPPQSQAGGDGGGGDDAYVTRLRRRQVDTYAVTEDEITSIDTQYWQASALFSLASVAAGGILSTVFAWETSGNWTLLGLLIAGALAFASIGLWVHRTRKSLLRRIKEQTLHHDE